MFNKYTYMKVNKFCFKMFLRSIYVNLIIISLSLQLTLRIYGYFLFWLILLTIKQRPPTSEVNLTIQNSNFINKMIKKKFV